MPEEFIVIRSTLNPTFNRIARQCREGLRPAFFVGIVL
jgi:hypothetical protein